LVDPNLFLLTEIRDSTDTDSVVVRYAVDGAGCHENRPELRVAGLSYSPRSSGGAYLFNVDVDYRSWDPNPAPDTIPGPCESGSKLLGRTLVDGATYSRSRIVERVRVSGSNNLETSADPGRRHR
jgi:hypothetical protein